MDINGFIGKKIDQTQGFLEDGRRIPLTTILVSGNWVTQMKTQEKDHYSAVQLGFGNKKKTTKALAGHIKKAGEGKTPRFFREVRTETPEAFTLGQEINVAEVLEPGDIIDITGTSKGKGYAGVVKRHNFKGGPRTHGQSDRERAPGSSGQTTTPGRVYKGKRMSGRMGDETVTIKNLTVIDIKDGILYVKGLIPGVKGGMVMISKVKENKESRAMKKKFVPLFKTQVEEEAAVGPVIEEVVVESLPEVEVAPEVKDEAEIAPETKKEVAEKAEETLEVK